MLDPYRERPMPIIRGHFAGFTFPLRGRSLSRSHFHPDDSGLSQWHGPHPQGHQWPLRMKMVWLIWEGLRGHHISTPVGDFELMCLTVLSITMIKTKGICFNCTNTLHMSFCFFLSIICLCMYHSFTAKAPYMVCFVVELPSLFLLVR